jgi:hypothetical protein
MTCQPQTPRDPNQLAKRIIDVSTGNAKAASESDLTKRICGPKFGPKHIAIRQN